MTTIEHFQLPSASFYICVCEKNESKNHIVTTFHEPAAITLHVCRSWRCRTTSDQYRELGYEYVSELHSGNGAVVIRGCGAHCAAALDPDETHSDGGRKAAL